MSILGALLGGALVFRLGASRLLAPSVFLIAAQQSPFSWLAWLGRPDPLVLATAISVDNLVTGMAGSVFIAFLSGLTNTAYTATQYALFSSIMTLPGKLIGGFSGVIVDWLQTRRATCRPSPPARPGRSAQVRRLRDSSSSTPRCSACPPWCWPIVVRRHFEKETPPSARKEGQ